MPSFSEAMGVILTFIVLSVAAGRRDLVWKTISEGATLLQYNS